MNLTELYNLAFVIASQAHKGQRDKAGLDYILHPVRVSNHCTSPLAKIVALLHDTIEDTNVTPDYLRQQGFHVFRSPLQEGGGEEVAVHAALLAKRNMDVQACHQSFFQNVVPTNSSGRYCCSVQCPG